jgi:hypothetical protein
MRPLPIPRPLSATKNSCLLCILLFLIASPFLTAQYTFLPIQYPAYQALVNPAVVPFENVFTDDQFTAGFHQRWSNERWNPQLDNNQQRLAFANLKLNDFRFRSLQAYRSLDMGGHLHFYEENNGAASLSAIYSGGAISIQPMKRMYRNQLIIDIGFNIGIIQHRIDYSKGIDNIPSVIRNANFASLNMVDTGGGLKIQYKSRRLGITGFFSTPANYGINKAYQEEAKKDLAFSGIQYYHTAISLQYLKSQKYIRNSYMQFMLQTAWNQTGKLVYPSFIFEYGLNNLLRTIVYSDIGVAAFNIGMSPGRESQVYRGDETDKPTAFIGFNASLPIYPMKNQQYLNLKLSYRYITDVDDLSGRSAHAVGLAFSLNRLRRYNYKKIWMDQLHQPKRKK